jgi:hypothetical protein
MPDWTIDSRVNVTEAGRALVLRQRQTRRPMLFCSICGQPVRVAFDDEPPTEAVTCAGCNREEDEPSPYAGTYSEE